jgi:putative phosphoesterase
MNNSVKEVIRVLVISDTHGDTSSLNEILTKNKYDFLFHLGDFENDINELSDIKVYKVRGNNDLFSNEPYDRIVEIHNIKFYLTHGHIYKVYDTLDRLYYRALEKKCHIALYGHTHFPHFERQNDLIIFNPGSLTHPRMGSKKSYGVIEIDSLSNVNIKTYQLD